MKQLCKNSQAVPGTRLPYRNRAALIDDFSHALLSLHQQMEWPMPGRLRSEFLQSTNE